MSLNANYQGRAGSIYWTADLKWEGDQSLSVKSFRRIGESESLIETITALGDIGAPEVVTSYAPVMKNGNVEFEVKAADGTTYLRKEKGQGAKLPNNVSVFAYNTGDGSALLADDANYFRVKIADDKFAVAGCTISWHFSGNYAQSSFSLSINGAI